MTKQTYRIGKPEAQPEPVKVHNMYLEQGAGCVYLMVDGFYVLTFFDSGKVINHRAIRATGLDIVNSRLHVQEG